MLCRTMLLGLVALAACGPPRAARSPSIAPGPAAATLAARQPDTAALARDIARLLEVSDVPGLSIAVVQDGRVIWSGAFGTVNDSARTPVNAETVFEAASLSKPVFAYIVLRLVDRGEFDLDRPLFEMLEYPRLAHDERYKRITGRMVLSHGSGLPNWGGESLTLQFDPGTAYGYSGEGFVLLQKVIEYVTGHSLEDLAQREVFQPLGMRRSSFVWQERFAGNAAYSRNWFWTVAPIERYAGGNAAASLITTSTDYAQFVAAVLTGRGLSREMWSEFLAPVRGTRPGVYVGLGIGVEDGPAGRVFFHSGNNGRRFTSYMIGDIAQGLGLVYLASAYDGITLAEALSSPVLGAEHPALHRAGWDRYDDPRQLASKSVQRAAVESGAEAARERFRAIRGNPATRLSVDGALQLGRILAGRGLDALAIEVIGTAVADAPDSARAHLVLGRVLESAGDLESARESYRRALALEPDDEDARQGIQWLEDRLAARARPVIVPLRILESYVGRYGERQVTMHDRRLYYQRGTGLQYPLTPMAEDLFELEGNATFRIRFVGDGTRPATMILGIYNDGSTDASERSR